MSVVQLSPKELWDSQILSWSATAALAFLVYDIALTLDDEVSFIWSQPKTSPTKWFFLFMRYFSLGAQIQAATTPKPPIPFSMSVCKKMYISHVLTGGFLFTAVEVILMIRVYALYQRNRWISVMMLLVLLCELISMPLVIFFTWTTLEFTPLCLLKIDMRAILLFGAGSVLPQVVALVLTLFKYRTAIREGWGKSPIVTRLTRDGTGIVVAIIAIWLSTSVSSIAFNDLFAYIGYYWLVSLTSSMGCRIVINTHRLSSVALPGGTSSPAASPRFTTLLILSSL